MKKWIVLAMIVCVAVCAEAGKKDKGAAKEQTKEQFVEAAKKRAEKGGKTFDQAKTEKSFDKLDKDGDGKLSAEEQAAKSKKGGKKGGKKKK
ncbi:MAG: hypothetical protein K9M45_09640 [Kiritimatiellales bacterium]|nr:hypothetical protein [Kiritimatiellales bacterium]